MASPLTPETYSCSTGRICQCSTKTLKMQCSPLETPEGRMRRKKAFEVHRVSVPQTDLLCIAFLLLIPEDYIAA